MSVSIKKFNLRTILTGVLKFLTFQKHTVYDATVRIKYSIKNVFL